MRQDQAAYVAKRERKWSNQMGRMMDRNMIVERAFDSEDEADFEIECILRTAFTPDGEYRAD